MRRINNLERGKILALIDKVPFFDAFTMAERERILDSNAAIYVAEEGEFIIEQGSRDTAFYVLMSGQARVVLNGQPQALARIQPGDFFGEIAFLLETPRSSNVISIGQSIMLGIDRTLLELLNATVREKIKDQIIEKLVAVVAESNRHL